MINSDKTRRRRKAEWMGREKGEKRNESPRKEEKLPRSEPSAKDLGEKRGDAL